MDNENLDKKLSELERDFGLKRASAQSPVEIIKTGVYGLDFVMDGGIQLVEGGHKIEFFGKESSGKTTFAQKIVAKYQSLGKTCVWIVSESFHKDWAEILGIDTKNLLLAYPETLEDAGETLLKLINSDVDLIVIDSVATLMPEIEDERDLNEPTRGTQAKAYSLLCRKINKAMAHKKTTILFINQIRIKMGVLYGNPEDTPCGKGLKHLYDTRIEYRSGKPIEIGTKEKKERIGVELNLYAKKNKLGVPQRKTIVDFYFTGNIDNAKSLLFAGIKYSIIKFSGKTYEYKKKRAVGKDKFIKLLNEKDWLEIEEEIWKRQK